MAATCRSELLLGFLVFLGFCLATHAKGSHFRGGVLDWSAKVINKAQSSYNVSFTYGLIWTMGEGPCGKLCSAASVGQAGPAVGKESFVCEKGCHGKPKLSDTAYTVTAVDQFDNWEQGSRTFYSILNGTGPFTIAIEGQSWAPLKYETSGDWRLQTEVTLGSRSDTGQPNSSPVAFNVPLYKLFTGCLLPIKLMVMDPDGDRVRCRWGKTPQECGGICSSFPGANLDPDTCTITPVSLLSFGSGQYAVSVVIEDYPYTDVYLNGQLYNDKKRFSQISTQFLVHASQNSLKCHPPQFFNSNWGNQALEVIKPGAEYTERLCARAAAGSLIKGFEVFSPSGMTKVSGKGPEKGSLCITLKWRPTIEQIGSHMVCVSPKQSDGMTSAPECIRLYVDAVDRCNPSPCVVGRTCVNVIDGYYCVNQTGPPQKTNHTELSSAACLLDVLDLVFLLDASNSLTDDDKNQMKTFMSRLVNTFGIGVNKTHVGVITFDNDPHVVFSLNTHMTTAGVLGGISTIPFGFGGTDTGKALKFLTEEMFSPAHGDRPNIPNVAVVLTDGQSKDPYGTEYYAKMGRAMGISIFGVGVGPLVDPNELKNMSSFPVDKYSFIIHSFSDLVNVGDKLVNTTCSVRFPNASIAMKTTPEPGCYDYDNCLTYGEDVCTDYPGWSSYHCRQWCGNCTGTTTVLPCADVEPNCVEYGYDICTKPELRPWALGHCRAYCGFPPCTGTPPRTTTTPKPTTPGHCRDRINNCAAYTTSVCSDKTYEGWVMDNCPAFCGWCPEYKFIPGFTINNVDCPPWKLPIECEIDYRNVSCCPLPICPPNFTFTLEKPHF